MIMMCCCLSASLLVAQARSGRAAYHAHTSEMVTCSRYEPHGSILKVTNPENGRTITVRVNGRGPFNGNRILDLSTGAFRKLYGGLGRGVGPVRYTVVRRGWGKPAYKKKH
jgi:rare lipoprotein A